MHAKTHVNPFPKPLDHDWLRCLPSSLSLHVQSSSPTLDRQPGPCHLKNLSAATIDIVGKCSEVDVVLGIPDECLFFCLPQAPFYFEFVPPFSSYYISRLWSITAGTPIPPPRLHTLNHTRKSSHNIATPSRKHRLRWSKPAAASCLVSSLFSR
jgi:hypothetical protein